MLKIISGSRRFVILTKTRAYKFPNPRRWVSFIRGINENLEERYWYSADGSRKRDPDRKWLYDFLAEIYYADRFGLCVVMERVDTNFDTSSEKYKADLDQLISDHAGLRFIEDAKSENLGYSMKSGERKLVFLDYGWFGGTPDWYIGT